MFDTSRVGDCLTPQQMNYLRNFAKDFHLQGLNGCKVSRTGNTFLVSTIPVTIKASIYITADDGSGYPDPLDQPNTYFAQLCAPPTTAFTYSGYQTFSPQTADGGQYVFNLGTGFIPEGSYLRCFTVSQQLFTTWNVGDLVYGTASGGPGEVDTEVTWFDGQDASGTVEIDSPVPALPSNQPIFALDWTLINQGSRFNFTPSGC
jgi:hypothetical protein